MDTERPYSLLGGATRAPVAFGGGAIVVPVVVSDSAAPKPKTGHRAHGDKNAAALEPQAREDPGRVAPQAGL